MLLLVLTQLPLRPPVCISVAACSTLALYHCSMPISSSILSNCVHHCPSLQHAGPLCFLAKLGIRVGTGCGLKPVEMSHVGDWCWSCTS
jgi:hypothetical protein